MKNSILIIVSILLSFVSYGQKEVTWEDLSKVEYTETFFEEYGMNFLYPKFDKSIKDLDGERITITGYFLDIDPEGKIFVLSKEPMASCFFCGANGPETAMELFFMFPPEYKTDDIITVSGRLELNSEDVDYMIYLLKDCEAIPVDKP